MCGIYDSVHESANYDKKRLKISWFDHKDKLKTMFCFMQIDYVVCPTVLMTFFYIKISDFENINLFLGIKKTAEKRFKSETTWDFLFKNSLRQLQSQMSVLSRKIHNLVFPTFWKITFAGA